jgi:ATP-binding cassette subfamily F protein 3
VDSKEFRDGIRHIAWLRAVNSGIIVGTRPVDYTPVAIRQLEQTSLILRCRCENFASPRQTRYLPMSLLTVTDLVRQFDVEPVLNRATFDVRLGDRIGLVGPNGAGKTTLLRILVGLDHPDSGQIQIASSSDIVLLEQHPDFAEGRTLIQEAREGLATIYQLQRESDEIAHQMAGLADSPESQRLHKRYDFVQHELQRLNGFQVDHRIDEVLQGLGFDKSQYDQPLTTLSGGQQNRVLLARMLLRAPELMLLDEPTNHLDIAATQWLEQSRSILSRSNLHPNP